MEVAKKKWGQVPISGPDPISFYQHCLRFASKIVNLKEALSQPVIAGFYSIERQIVANYKSLIII